MSIEHGANLFDYLERRGLELPPFGDDFLELLVPEVAGTGWKTTGGPNIPPMQDYMQKSFDAVLAAPLSPHWALNFAGHGVNSYSANLRMVIGPVLIVAQYAWGGVYEDQSTQRDAWNEGMESLEEFFDTLDLSTDIHEVPSPRAIEVAVRYSDFRGSRALYRKEDEGLIEIPLNRRDTFAQVLDVVLGYEQPSWGLS